jgi:Na+-transporting methylmalonyl-CoA/oxaloacetate decarboxylase gamma subunit
MNRIPKGLAVVLIVVAIVALSLWGLSAFTPGGKATDQPLPEDEADNFAILPAQHFLGSEISTSRGHPPLWSPEK